MVFNLLSLGYDTTVDVYYIMKRLHYNNQDAVSPYLDLEFENSNIYFKDTIGSYFIHHSLISRTRSGPLVD